MIATSPLGNVALGTTLTLPASVLPDTILKSKVIDRGYLFEFAWGGNLTQTATSTGAYKALWNGSFQAPINGINCSYVDLVPGTPTLTGNDSHSNYFQMAAGVEGKITWDSTITANEILIYQFPNVDNNGVTTAFKVQISTDDVTYTTVYQATDDGPKTRINLGVATTFRYLKYVPYNSIGGSNAPRITAIEVYNWQDETDVVEQKTPGEPQVVITVSNEDGQNSTPDPSQCTIVLDNVSKRFSQYNASSAIYGTAQADGKGSGVRAGVPIRVTATATNSNGDEYEEVIFRGFIGDDNNPGGSSGLSFNDMAETLTVSCKSTSSLLSKAISLPVYQGADLTNIIKDAFYHSGIADQDIAVPEIGHSVPMVVFPRTTAKDIIDQVLEVLPFTKIKEDFVNEVFEIVPAGRFRSDYDFKSVVGNSRLYSGVSVGNDVYLFDFTEQYLYKFDIKKSISDGVTELTTSLFPLNVSFSCPFGNKILFIDKNAVLYSYDTTASFSIVTEGAISSIAGGYTTFQNATFYDHFLYVIASSGATHKLFVFDLNFPFSLTVDKGAITSGDNIGANENYLVSCVDLSGEISLWKHDGDPVGDALDLSTITSGTPLHGTAVMTSDNSIVSVGDGMDMHVYKLNLDTAYSAPSTAPTDLGFLPQLQPGIADSINLYYPIEGFNPGNFNRLNSNGTYIYFSTDSNCIYCYDTTKDISKATFIGLGINNNSIFSYPLRNSNVEPASGYYDIGQATVVDSKNRVWFVNHSDMTDYFISNSRFSAFQVQSDRNIQPESLTSLSVNDGFLVSMQLNDGNPTANRVILTSSPFTFVTDTTNTLEEFRSPKRTLTYTSKSKTFRGKKRVTLGEGTRYKNIGNELSSLLIQKGLITQDERFRLVNEGAELWTQQRRGVWPLPYAVTVIPVDLSLSVRSCEFGNRTLAVPVKVLNPVITRSGSVATMSCTAIVGVSSDGDYVRITGCEQMEYNGIFEINNLTATSFDYLVGGTPSSPATGTPKIARIVFDDPTTSTDIAIGTGAIGSFTFFGWTDFAYILIYGGENLLTRVEDMSIQGITFEQSNSFTLDRKSEDVGEDLIATNSSRSIYKKEYLVEIESQLISDPSFFMDILNNGKFSRLYADPIECPWYPYVKPNMPINISSTNYGMTDRLFTVSSYTIDGFKTTIKAKEALDAQLI